MYDLYFDITECDYCKKPAKVVWLYSGMFKQKSRLFCKDCAKEHKRVRSD